MFLGWQRQVTLSPPPFTQQADWVVGARSCSFQSVSCELIGGCESLQGGGGELLDTPLGQEGALDGLQLWGGLGVL